MDSLMENQRQFWAAPLHYLSATVILDVYWLMDARFGHLEIRVLVGPILLALAVHFALRLQYVPVSLT